MRERILYGTNMLVDEFIQNLQQIEETENVWGTKYKNPLTGECWVKYVVDLERGYYYNLMKTEPTPTTEELIDIALNSEFEDEISAAARRLHLDEELLNIEFREKLLSKLGQLNYDNLTETDKRRIETIIKASELEDRVNHRGIVGKSFQKINEDYQFTLLMADKAEDILRRLK
jgi:hypothetical protein